jgi:hypothetical protein
MRTSCIERLFLSLLAAAAALAAQGTKPRDFPAQYTAHVQLGTTWIGADFHGHIVNTPKASYETPRYLVVEVAVFAPGSKKVDIDPTQFLLTVNGRTLTPQPPNVVSLALKNPVFEEQQRPHLETEADVGGVTASTGQPPMGPRFPGDSDPANNRMQLPKVDTDPSRGSVEQEHVDPADAIRRVGLEPGQHMTPVAGLLFYAWEGKLKKIKSLKLEYSSPHGTATLDLQ